MLEAIIIVSALAGMFCLWRCTKAKPVEPAHVNINNIEEWSLNEQRLLEGINQLRKNKLVADKALYDAAMVRLSEMEGITHDGFNTFSAKMKEKYGFVTLGEVLAKGYKSPDSVRIAWMNSPPHKRLITRESFKWVAFVMIDNRTIGILGK